MVGPESARARTPSAAQDRGGVPHVHETLGCLRLRRGVGIPTWLGVGGGSQREAFGVLSRTQPLSARRTTLTRTCTRTRTRTPASQHLHSHSCTHTHTHAHARRRTRTRARTCFFRASRPSWLLSVRHFSSLMRFMTLEAWSPPPGACGDRREARRSAKAPARAGKAHGSRQQRLYPHTCHSNLTHPLPTRTPARCPTCRSWCRR